MGSTATPDQLAQEVSALRRQAEEQTPARQKILALNRIFSQLSEDPETNIEILVQNACQVIGSAFALYSRSDATDGHPIVCVASHPPAALSWNSSAAGRNCYGRTLRGNDPPLILENLQDLAASDPTVKECGLKTYIGAAIILDGKPIGTLCALSTQDRAFDDTDAGIFGTLAATVALEARRSALSQAAEEIQARYKGIFVNTLNGVAVLEAVDGGRDFRFLTVNRAAEAIDQIDGQQITGQRILDVLPGLKPFGLFDRLQKVWASGEPEHLAGGFYRDERISGWREYYIYKLPSAEIIIVYKDITSLKRAEEELRRSQGEYHRLYEFSRLVADNVPDLIWAKDMEDRFQFVNQAMCDKLLKCDGPDQAISQTSEFFAEQERVKGYRHTFGDICADSDLLTKESQKPGRFLEDGLVRNQYLALDVYKAPFFDKAGKMIGIVGSGRDVTKEKQMENALQESENRFATFMGHFPGAAFMCDENLQLIYSNAYMQRVLGEMAHSGQPLHALFTEGRPDKITMDCLRALTEGLQESNEVLTDVDSRKRTYRMLKFPVYKAGKSTILGGIGIDITQQVEAEMALKKAYDDAENEVDRRTQELQQSNSQLKVEIDERRQVEARLRNSEERFRTIVENISDIIYSFGEDGRITDLTTSREDVFGYLPKNMIGCHFRDVVHPQDRGEIEKLFNENLHLRRPFQQGIQFRVLGKDGACHWLEANVRSKFDARGTFVRGDGILREITATKLLLDKLIRSERMAAMGQLAATVAHQIGSPLQCATAMMNVIRKGREKDEKLKDQLDLLKDAFDGIEDTIGQLTDLNAAGHEKRQPTDINQIVEETVALMKGLLQKNHVQVQLMLSPELPHLSVSAQQLGQVFMNLVQNSVEALARMAAEQGPASKAQERRVIRIESRWENNAAVIQFSDNGPGIAESDLNQIFDPFYTHKGGSALGIGLSICSSIIDGHGGTIAASNLTKRGALFKITLPTGNRSNG